MGEVIKINKILLRGCTSRPIVNYLKSLGILRLVAVQADSMVKGFWDDTIFGLETQLSEIELENFFCRSYTPTPLVAPWNGSSGFYPGDNTSGLDAIIKTSDHRFQPYKEVIQTIRSWPEIPKNPKTVKEVEETLERAIETIVSEKQRKELREIINNLREIAKEILSDEKPQFITFDEIEKKAKDKRNPSKQLWSRFFKAASKARTKSNSISRSGSKEQILAICRSRLPDYIIDWLDAVYALNSQGEAFYNPVLGTGANEGHLEFSNNFMQRVTGLLLDKPVELQKLLLSNSLFGQAVSGLEKAKIGQFNPGKAGGFNQGTGVETKDFAINPWDYVLAFEGALLMASSITRRSPANNMTYLSAPFSVRFSPVGFTSSDYGENGRGEVWLPLWGKPSGYPEVKQLFGEGRSVLGKRAARTGIEFSRAVSTLGVDRGIRAFERYAFLERRGQSYVALPAGRFKVSYHSKVNLLKELDPILKKLDDFLGRFQNIPASYLSTRRQIDEAIFACTRDTSTHQYKSLIRAIGRMECIIAQRDRNKEPSLARPLWGLSPNWVIACDDGSVELRIASSLASITSTEKVGSIRTYMSGVSAGSPARWGESNNDNCWVGGSCSERLANLILRRIMDAERYGVSRFPLNASLPISANDVMPFLNEETDDNSLEELLWGFTLINWRESGIGSIWGQIKKMSANKTIISRTWCILKLLHSPYPVRKKTFRHEPRIGNLLMAGRINEACQVAITRLRISDLTPFNVTYEEPLNHVRLLASLAIPVYDQARLESLVLI